MNATLPASTANAIGQRVTDLLSGRVALSGDMSLMLRLPLTLKVEDVGDSVIASLTPSQEIDRSGVNPWLESIQVYPSGRVLAHLSKGPFTFDRDISPATAPRLGLMDLGSVGSTLVLAENPIVAKAEAAGHDPETVRKALEAAIREVPPTAAGRRRGANRLQRKAARETAIKAGLAANGVPESYWKYAFGLLSLLTFLVPPPWNAAISAVLWGIDQLLT